MNIWNLKLGLRMPKLMNWRESTANSESISATWIQSKLTGTKCTTMNNTKPTKSSRNSKRSLQIKIPLTPNCRVRWTKQTQNREQSLKIATILSKSRRTYSKLTSKVSSTAILQSNWTLICWMTLQRSKTLNRTRLNIQPPHSFSVRTDLRSRITWANAWYRSPTTKCMWTRGVASYLFRPAWCTVCGGIRQNKNGILNWWKLILML